MMQLRAKGDHSQPRNHEDRAGGCPSWRLIDDD